MDENLKKIKEIILNVAKEMNIEIDKIILFGSRARGDNREDSDYDILIVTKEKLDRERELKFRSEITSQFFELIKVDVELIIADKKTFEEYKTPAYVYYYAEKEGKLLWYSRINEDVKELLKVAMENLEAVNYIKSEKIYEHVCLHCSWAVRNFLKAFLIFNQIEFSKPQDIVELAKLCMKFDKDFKDMFQNEIESFKKLMEYDIAFKESILFDASDEEAQKAIKIAEKVKEFVLKKLKERGLEI